MTTEWEQYDDHWMTQGTTRNRTFHQTQDCRKIKYAEKAVNRSASFLAYHEPEPCEACHDDVDENRHGTAANKYTKAISGGDD